MESLQFGSFLRCSFKEDDTGDTLVAASHYLGQSRAMASNPFAENSANLHLCHAKFCLKDWYVQEFAMHCPHVRSVAVEIGFLTLSLVGFWSPLYPPTCYSPSWFGFSLANCMNSPDSELFFIRKYCNCLNFVALSTDLRVNNWSWNFSELIT